MPFCGPFVKRREKHDPFPAIDLYEGHAVRLYQGDYRQMTVYSPDPVALARKFAETGATHIHLVDLEGARDGTTPNLQLIRRIAAETGLFVEVGGGIRNMDIARAYLENGVSRVILGTAASPTRTFCRMLSIPGASGWPLGRPAGRSGGHPGLAADQRRGGRGLL